LGTGCLQFANISVGAVWRRIWSRSPSVAREIVVRCCLFRFSLCGRRNASLPAANDRLECSQNNMDLCSRRWVPATDHDEMLTIGGYVVCILKFAPEEQPRFSGRKFSTEMDIDGHHAVDTSVEEFPSIAAPRRLRS